MDKTKDKCPVDHVTDTLTNESWVDACGRRLLPMDARSLPIRDLKSGHWRATSSGSGNRPLRPKNCG
jgi:hypothetical protein